MAGISAWLCVVALAMVACFGEGAQARRSLLQTTTCAEPALPDVNLAAYAGVWYQIGSTALMKSIAEQNLACTTGRYSVIDSGANVNDIRLRIDAYNTSSGEYSSLVGLATVNGRKLALQFPGSSTPSDYRIIYLSGDVNDKYKTAVTYSCTPGAIQTVNILSRKPSLDSDESIQGLLQYAASQNITLEANNQFVPTVQDKVTCGRNDD